MQEVIAPPRQDQPQPGVHARLLQLRRREFNRRQDGNYNGGFPAYIDNIAAVEAAMETHFVCTRG